MEVARGRRWTFVAATTTVDVIPKNAIVTPDYKSQCEAKTTIFRNYKIVTKLVTCCNVGTSDMFVGAKLEQVKHNLSWSKT
jgi:hypothetical protein